MLQIIHRRILLSVFKVVNWEKNYQKMNDAMQFLVENVQLKEQVFQMFPFFKEKKLE